MRAHFWGQSRKLIFIKKWRETWCLKYAIQTMTTDVDNCGSTLVDIWYPLYVCHYTLKKKLKMLKMFSMFRHQF